MKTKIIINDEQVEITLTPEQVEAITAQQKPKQWEPEGGIYNITHAGNIYRIPSTTGYKNFGAEYQTQAQAEKARDVMRPHNRLLAWLAENDDGWVADWEDVKQSKYYIYLDCTSKRYGIDARYVAKGLAEVYMSKQNAIKLYKLLNSGEVAL